MFAYQAPVDFYLCKIRTSEICQFNISLQRFTECVVPLRKTGKQDDISAEPPELFTTAVPFLLPECIQDSFQGGSLSGEVSECQ